MVRPRDLVFTGYQNGADSQESDSADDLGTESCHIQLGVKCMCHIFTGHHDQGRTQADQYMGLDSGSAPFKSAVDSDCHAYQHRQKQPQSDCKGIPA